MTICLNILVEIYEEHSFKERKRNDLFHLSATVSKSLRGNWKKTDADCDSCGFYNSNGYSSARDFFTSSRISASSGGLSMTVTDLVTAMFRPARPLTMMTGMSLSSLLLWSLR